MLISFLSVLKFIPKKLKYHCKKSLISSIIIFLNSHLERGETLLEADHFIRRFPPLCNKGKLVKWQSMGIHQMCVYENIILHLD